MPKTVTVSDESLGWLKQHHTKLPYSELASKVGCCVDTLKRILVREGLQDFDGAKYQVKRDEPSKMWTRPCMTCKDTKPRPKNYFFCLDCRREMGYDD